MHSYKKTSLAGSGIGEIKNDHQHHSTGGCGMTEAVQLAALAVIELTARQTRGGIL
jgi:hypothetical protein